jgi:hypothetical protein
VLGLILRLSHLDADAAGAVRIIAYFDRLVEHRASLDALVRAAAGLAECPAALRDHRTGRLIRYDPHGRPVHDPAPGSLSGGAPDSGTWEGVRRAVRIDEQDVAEVWLERAGGPGPHDEMLVERMAVAAGALWPAASRAGTMADPALVELAISPSAPPPERARGLRLLGFAPRSTMLAIAVAGTETVDAAAEAVARSLATAHGHLARAAVIGSRGVVLTQAEGEARPVLTAPPEVRLGVGRPCSAQDLPACWQEAATAVRFAGVLGRGRVVRFEELGALSALARVPPDVVNADPDVRALRALAATEQGTADLAALTAYCVTGSLRQAADVLHMHHSSVARRIHQASRRLGLDLDRPDHRLRTEIALILTRLTAE